MRAEIDSLNSKYMDASRRLEDANRKAARVDQLLEEIQIYKEMAQNVAAESQGSVHSLLNFLYS